MELFILFENRNIQFDIKLKLTVQFNLYLNIIHTALDKSWSFLVSS